MAEFPTAYQVARAIVMAAEITGADPLDVAAGKADPESTPQTWAIAHARMYAAKALHKGFDITATAAARMVGVLNYQTQKSLLLLFDAQRKRGGAKWYHDAIAERIGKAARQAAPLPIPRIAPQPVRMVPAQKLPAKVDHAAEARRVERAIEGRGRFEGLGSPEPAILSPTNKKLLYDTLAEAAANTAREQERMRRDVPEDR